MIPRGTVSTWLEGKAVHVVGASGAEGAAMLLFLVDRCGITNVVAHDFSSDDRGFARSFRRANSAWDRKIREHMLKRLRRLPITFALGERYLANLDQADVIFAGQNWFNYPSNVPAIPAAVAAGAALYGVVDLAMALFGGLRIGITGSNGKSTTSALVTHLLGSDEAPVLQGGNDRDRQVALARLADAEDSERLVWEVSNRHLRDRPVDVDIAVVTNITRNHIEDHGSWEAYVAAKARLPNRAPVAVLSAVDPVSLELHAQARKSGTLWTFGSGDGDGPRVWVEGATLRFVTPQAEGAVEVSSFPLPGDHNRLNLAAAVAVSLAAGLDPAAIGPALDTFGPLAGRLELVAERDGVQWVYDIQATTAPAAAAGIQAVGETREVVLIVGGEDKGMDFTAMADAAASAQAILALPGTGTDAFLAALGDRVPVTSFATLDELLAAARQAATPGSTVLLSPGCAFFHREFLDGGPTFAKRVAKLLDPAP